MAGSHRCSTSRSIILFYGNEMEDTNHLYPPRCVFFHGVGGRPPEGSPIPQTPKTAISPAVPGPLMSICWKMPLKSDKNLSSCFDMKDRQADGRESRQADRQTYRLISRQADRQARISLLQRFIQMVFSASRTHFAALLVTLSMNSSPHNKKNLSICIGLSF